MFLDPLQVYSISKEAILGLLEEYISKVDKNIQHYQWVNILGICEAHLMKNL